MLEKPPELAPDLEWMLQSNQVSEGLLLETAITENYEWVYHITLCILDDPEMADRAARETFTTLIKRRHRYWGQLDARSWILRYAIKTSLSKLPHLKRSRAISAVFKPQTDNSSELPDPQTSQDAEIWLRFDSLPLIERLPYLLVYVLHEDAENLPVILGINPRVFDKRIGRAGKKLEKLAVADKDIPASLSRRWPRRSSSKGEVEELKETILHHLDEHTRSERMSSYVRQTLIVVALALFVGGIAWLTNQIAAKQTSNPLSAPTVIVTKIVQVYITPTPAPEETPVPLNNSSTEEMVWERIAESRSLWNTVWIEANIYQYGIPGYVGPPYTRRDQVWVNKPHSSLVVSGPIGGQVDKVWYALNGRVYDVRLPDGYPVLYDFHGDSQPVYSAVSDLIFPEDIVREGTFDIRGIQEIAGRSALIVDLHTETGLRKNRFWVDIHTGVLLGIREYAEDGVSFLYEIMASKVYFDEIFPEHVFDRSDLITFFVEDYRGAAMSEEIMKQQARVPAQPGHIPLAKIAPPLGFDAASSELTFQWALPSEMATDVNIAGYSLGRGPDFAAEVPIDLFAGAYHLSELEIGSPWRLACGRSPDGNVIVLGETPEPGNEHYPLTRLRWIDLSSPERVNELLLEGSTFGNDFAFSPDSRYLVFYGCLRESLDCGVYRLDTKTLEQRRLASIGYVDSFVWNPDGSEIAMLGVDDSLYVMQVDTGKITYQGPETSDQALDQNTPINAWEVSFPPLRTGLQGCHLPG
jgi:DNA-directed RNA polymerase specialized sigma24 family protein